MKEMDFIEDKLQEKEMLSAFIQLQLMKEKITWEDEQVQLFIPVALAFCDFDWLKLIAENTLIQEDVEIVKNFIDMCESLKNFNSRTLKSTAIDNMKKRRFGL